jgi:Protein of unknown function (DUF1501)
MLSLRDPLARREFLRIGGLALGGLSLASTFAPAGSPLATTQRPLTDKAVIFLFLHGGPSQIETFDPKMTAPDTIRSATGEVKTTLPGITFGGTFPKLAARAQQLAIVRSFVTGDGNHDIKPIVGRDSFGANLGSAFAAVAGTNHPRSGMPTNVALFPQAVEAESQPFQKGFGNFLASGPFGMPTEPIVPGGGGTFQKNLTLNFPPAQLDDRRSLLTAFDRAKSHVESSDRSDPLREKAFSILLGGVADAFDWKKEDPKVVAAYDTASLVNVARIDKKWNNHKFYADNVRTLGKLLLLARRLCERGAGFVTVTTNFVWDMHADANNATITEGMSYMAPPLDHAIAAFLDDVRERGLHDKILLVVCGEMGRTPVINSKGGRDHWGELAPLVLAGGGLPMGQVIGRSDAKAGTPNTEPIGKAHLISTIYHSLFDVGKLRVTRGVPRELLTMVDAPPIPGLV